MACLHAISSLLEKDRRKRIGAIGFGSFTDNPFFQQIDFEALEKKSIFPIFVPSSEKTNFDATYDLEELLLEEAPLEARARRQKPRVQLKDDATDKEIRTDELHRMIETLFEPFDYTLMGYVTSLLIQGLTLPLTPSAAITTFRLQPLWSRRLIMCIMNPKRNLAWKSRLRPTVLILEVVHLLWQ